MKLIIAALALLTGQIAMADQCQWNTTTDARSAVQLINLHKEVMFLCQNCGDKKPSFISKVDYAESKQIKEYDGSKTSYRGATLFLDGKQQEIDLAYTYVRTASDIFTNIAHLVGCDSTGATTFIQNKGFDKILHFYDETGVRKNVSTVRNVKVQTGFPEGRVPASDKK